MKIKSILDDLLIDNQIKQQQQKNKTKCAKMTEESDLLRNGINGASSLITNNTFTPLSRNNSGNSDQLTSITTNNDNGNGKSSGTSTTSTNNTTTSNTTNNNEIQLGSPSSSGGGGGSSNGNTTIGGRLQFYKGKYLKHLFFCCFFFC